MKGSPRSLWLSMTNRMANQAIGYWSGLFASAAKRNQSAFLKSLTVPPKPPSKPKRAGKARHG
ncbi:hypothetical protein J2847_003040 [Azospirillum agricola]|uniref:hypothetical protein n=1 Tax=Azospirillum agricola TaxID=1720247 RepID=UPI001AE8C99D|nr:hypothetical protein [Azospirillum agricola]MBP2229741.1 hypothetical protein [Azospirillum agricola]